MRITKQNYANECGVCVINSLHEHFYKKNRRIDVLNNAKINENGLSIYEFENTCANFGLWAESYELDFEEFTRYNSNKYFVLPIKKESLVHYVIAYKNKNKFIVYDSCNNEPQQVNINDFKQKFIGVLIEVNKFQQKFQFKQNKKIDIFKNIRYSYFFISIFLNIVIIALSTISANYLNVIINNAISNEIFKYVLQITFIFFMFLILGSLVKWVLKLYSLKNFRICFQMLSNNLLISLNCKGKHFIHKVDPHNFYFIDMSIQTIASFVTLEISNLCSNIFMSILLIGIFIFINPIFLFISALILITSFIFCYFQYLFKKMMLKKGLDNQSFNNKVCNEYINYFNTQKNSFLSRKIQNDMLANYDCFTKLSIKKTKYESCCSFVSETIHNIIYLISIVICTYLIIQLKQINLGELTLLICLTNMLSDSTNRICDYFLKYAEFKQMLKIYNDFVCIENIKHGDFKIEECNSLQINDKEILNKEKINRGELKYLIDEHHFNNVFINNVNLLNIDFESYNNLLFYLNENSVIKKEWLIEKLESNHILIETIKDLQLNLYSNKIFTNSEQKKINLCFLLTLNKKLIILDESFTTLIHQDYHLILNNLIDNIAKNNFVIFVK